MRKVVYDSDAALRPPHLHPTTHALKRPQRIVDGFRFDAPGVGGDDHCQTVADIEITDQCRLKLAPCLAFAKDAKAGQLIRIVKITRLPHRVRAGAEGFEPRVE